MADDPRCRRRRRRPRVDATCLPFSSMSRGIRDRRTQRDTQARESTLSPVRERDPYNSISYRCACRRIASDFIRTLCTIAWMDLIGNRARGRRDLLGYRYNRAEGYVRECAVDINMYIHRYSRLQSRRDRVRTRT